MDRQTRFRLDSMDLGFLPDGPATYAVYRSDERVYAGETGNLATRVVKHHLARTPSSIAQSALRRNLAEHLGIATAADLKTGRAMLTDAQREQLHTWLLGCEIAWTEHEGKAAAIQHKRDLLAELMPLLNQNTA
jgi:hypothetical protein